MSDPVKYFTALLTGDVSLRDAVITCLSKHFGDADFIGPWHPFTHTSYYEDEMGKDLSRSFISFADLKPPELLAKSKIWSGEAEEEFKKGGSRLVNIDPGYIDFGKAILASGKEGNHKIAVSGKCFADMVLFYNGGKFDQMPWTFPDFAAGIYNKDLLEIRRIFKKQKQTLL